VAEHKGIRALIGKRLAVWAAVSLTATVVHAGPLVDIAGQIETEMSAGNSEVAASEARALYETVLDQSVSLFFSDTLLISEPAAGYGIYNPRPNEKFKRDEPIILYAEPVGFGYGSPGEGLYSINFDVDLRVMTEIGEPLADIPNLTQLTMTSRYKNREFQANLTYNLAGFEPGRYLLLTTLRDKNSPKTGTFETVIEIVE
jgi:hypothetical protein